ncbi:NEP1-interacting protein 2 isoform X1 [Brassica rapa]|uniref:NEP1-interacting protein 2 isoform X1 n=1 Tax=Brassica campestris TaxID=3711 RepID=UPI00142D6F88|nr:NEP1-interacting protein 2 isoform X1 [Brassica rapa]
MAFQSGFYPLSTTPSLGNVVERMKEACHLHVSALLGTIISANLIFFFALVGTLLGAFTGALIGQETESGFIRGAEIGAFYGAVVSIEVFQSSIQLWRLDESCLVYLHDVVVSLLSGRLVRERIAPAIRQRISLLETGGSTLTITGNNNADDSGNRESCSICLQDYQRGEIVRILPSCRHMFHLPCIDSWFLEHRSCPLFAFYIPSELLLAV